MPATSADELLHRLRTGNIDPADPLYLERVGADELIAELAAVHPVRFQERRLKNKWEVGLARSVEHRLLCRRLHQSPFLVVEFLPVLRHCLMLSGEGTAVTGWSFTPQVRLRRGTRAAREIVLATAAGFKLDRFPDGWEVKRLGRKKVQLTEDFLRQRGWRFDPLLPPFPVVGHKSQP